MTTIKELLDSKIINIDCTDISKLLAKTSKDNDNTLIITLIDTLFRAASLREKLNWLDGLVTSFTPENVHIVNDTIIKYMPHIIGAILEVCAVLTDEQIAMLHNILNHILDNKAEMKDILSGIIRVACDTHQRRDEPVRFLIELILIQKDNFGFLLLEKLLKLEEPSDYVLVCGKKYILFSRIIELIQLKRPIEASLPSNKENDYCYISKYDNILRLFTENNDAEWEECIFGVFVDILGNRKEHLYCVKYTYDLFDKDFKRYIANNIPAIYIAHTICPKSFQKEVIDGLTTLCINDLSPITINKIILVVHGSLRYQLMQLNPNPYDGKNYTKRLDKKQFCFETIDIIRNKFPEQFKKIIINELFMKRINIFEGHGYSDNEDKKILIKYTDYLNKLGLLPYDKICNNFMTLLSPDTNSDPNNITVPAATLTCAGCLMETYWVVTDCKHSLCRECFVSTVFCESNIDEDDIEDCELCIMCKSLNTMKKMKNYDSGDDSDDDDDDDSDD